MGNHGQRRTQTLICYTPVPMTIEHAKVTTAFELPGARIVKNLGAVRGVVVRSRSIVGTIGAGLQSIVGGDITLFTQLAEKTREDAFNRMCTQASGLGANAIIGFRYDATDMGGGITEVIAYGTAVVVE